jgi:hypothetical protein
MSRDVDMRKTQMPITTAQLLWQLQDKTLSSSTSITGLECGVLGKRTNKRQWGSELWLVRPEIRADMGKRPY